MTTSSLIDAVTERFTGDVSASYVYRGDATLIVPPGSIIALARLLKDDPDFSMNFLVDITAVDYALFGKAPAPAFFASSGVTVKPSPEIPDADPWPGPPETRFTVVYHFFSTVHKHRLRVVVPVPDAGDDVTPEVDSLSSLWPGANWLEREVFDMFGIGFRGHPDLKRILMYEEFEGYPLRKDYPVKGRQPLVRRRGQVEQT